MATLAWPQVVAAAGLLVVVTLAAIGDLRTQRISNKLTYPAIAAGFLFWLIVGLVGAGAGGGAGVWQSLQPSLFAAAVGFVPFAILFAIGGVGGGDLKLMTAVGAIAADWQCVLMVMFVGFLVGAILSVAVMVRRRLVRQTLSRVWLATALTLFRKKGQVIPDDSPRVPLAVGFAVGALLAAAEYLLRIPMPWSPATGGAGTG